MSISEDRMKQLAEIGMSLTQEEVEYFVIGLGVTRMGVVGAFSKDVLEKVISIKITDDEWEGFLRHMSFNDEFIDVFLAMIADYWKMYLKSKAKVN